MTDKDKKRKFLKNICNKILELREKIDGHKDLTNEEYMCRYLLSICSEFRDYMKKNDKDLFEKYMIADSKITKEYLNFHCINLLSTMIYEEIE